MVIKLELDDAALDVAQAKADKLVATLNKAEEIAARLMAKEKPPEGGKTCERTPPDPELLRKAQARVDARKRGSDDSVDILCGTLDKVIRCVAQDVFKPPN